VDRADERQELERLKHGIGGKRRRSAAVAPPNRNTSMPPPMMPRLSIPVLPKQTEWPVGPSPAMPPQRPLPGPAPIASPPATERVRRASFAPGSTPPWGQQPARREVLGTAAALTPEEGAGKKPSTAEDAASEEFRPPDEGKDREDEDDEGDDADDDIYDENYDDEDDDDDRSDERDEFSEDDD